jgi:hypothetical protein
MTWIDHLVAANAARAIQERRRCWRGRLLLAATSLAVTLWAGIIITVQRLL